MREGVPEGRGDRGVVSVGELLVDLIAHEAPDLERAERFLRAAGGAPANVAVAVSRLGVPASFVGAVGDDPFGRFARGVLEDNGVSTEGMVTMDPTRGRTTLALVAKNAGGIPDFIFYRGAEALLEPRHIPTDLIERAAFVHVSSMALMCEPAASATIHAVARATAHGVPVSVDPNLRPSSWPSLETALRAIEPLLEAANILKVNDQEARHITGERDMDRALKALRGGRDRLVVITLGADGCIWQTGNITGGTAAPTVEVEDTTGAGDAFVGAMLAELYRRGGGGRDRDTLPADDMDSTMRFACAAAAVSCTRAGAMPALPTRSQVEELLRRAKW